VCIMAADTMEALGIERGQYVVRVSNRKVLEGLLDIAGATGEKQRLTVLRAIDKIERLGPIEVIELLRDGRTDPSGDRTEGAKLSAEGCKTITEFILSMTVHTTIGYAWEKASLAIHDLSDDDRVTKQGTEYFYDNLSVVQKWRELLRGSQIAEEGLVELESMANQFRQAGYGSRRIKLSSDTVRGLEYYTGPIFECELFNEVFDENGLLSRFGSVGGGGRYDDLVARFTGQKVPATGFSIGVSRLYAALQHLKKTSTSATLAPVVVTVMDKDRQGDYWKFVQDLRTAGIRTEMFIGTGNMGKQMKYADKRGSPLVIIQGGDEKAKGEVQIKDLRLGSELATTIETREEYASQRLAQWSCKESDLVSEVKKALAR
jgi:histidyl-tRNA synthetase